MDIIILAFSIVISLYMLILYLLLSDKFLPGCQKYYLTPVWLFRKDILNYKGQKIRAKINLGILFLIFISVIYFWAL